MNTKNTLKNTIVAGAIGLAGLVSATVANAAPACEKRADNDKICILREEARTVIYHKCHYNAYLLCTVSVSEKGKETEYADLGCTGKATSIAVTDINGTETKARNNELKDLFTKIIDTEYKSLVTLAQADKQ